MSVGEERAALGKERRLMFENLALGVPQQMIAEAYERSPEEVWRHIRLVAKKVTEYRHRRCMRPAGIAVDPTTGKRVAGRSVPQELGLLPPIPCDTEEEIQLNAEALLWTLQFLTDENLSSEFLFIPTLTRHEIKADDPLAIEQIREAAAYVHVGARAMQ